MVNRPLWIVVLSQIYLNFYAQITLDEFLDEKFNPETFDGVVVDKQLPQFYQLKNNKIVTYSFSTGEIIDTLIDFNLIDAIKNIDIQGFEASMNGNVLLCWYNAKPIYRNSFEAIYFLAYRKAKKITILADSAFIRDASLSPDNSHIAFIKTNNLYIQKLTGLQVKQITFDGKLGKVFNAVPDWLYEEEFSLLKGYEWSANGKFLLYYRFNDSQIPVYPLTRYHSLQGTYPVIDSIAYPRAGEKLPEVDIFLYNINTGMGNKLFIPNNTNCYIPRIGWTISDNTCYVMQLNRKQNIINYWLIDTRSLITSKLFTDSIGTFFNEPDYKALHFINVRNDFIYLSERDGYRHIWKGGPNNQHICLTHGNYDVKTIIGYDNKTNDIFYLSNELSPIKCNLFSIHVDKPKKTLLTPFNGNQEVIFSTDYNYFINYYSSNNYPLQVDIFNKKGRKVKRLVSNEKLLERVKEYQLPIREFFTFVTVDSTILYGSITKPFHFDSTHKYPVLFYVYGGPGVQLVKDSWNIPWYNYLAMHGFIIVSVDNRGTAGRSKSFESALQKRLGTVEVMDLIQAVNYISKFSYIDTSRINILGWSYGGYLSAMSFFKGNGIFKNAVSVAPVTDWLLYDAAYTERYMGIPDENKSGYTESSLLTHARLVSGNLLLIHGTADDNVHIQHTLLLAEKLVQMNIPFDMHIYTDKNHSINGGNTRRHLYNKVIQFFINNNKME